MTEHVVIRIPVVDAEPQWYGDTEGGEVRRVCGLCQRECKPDDGRAAVDKVVVSRTYGTVHAECYVKQVTSEPAAWAWLVVAREVAARPRKYTSAEVRAVLTALERIVFKEPE